MFNKELIVPALIGLGLYAQNSEINLANNTSILLILFLLLRDDLGGIFGGGIGEIEFQRLARERRYARFDRFGGCPYFDECNRWC